MIIIFFLAQEFPKGVFSSTVCSSVTMTSRTPQRSVLSVYLVGWPGRLRAAAATAAAAPTEGSSQSTAHDVAHGWAHSHASGSGGHLSHETRSLGRCRWWGHGRGRRMCRRWSVCRSCWAKNTKQHKILDVCQRFEATTVKSCWHNYTRVNIKKKKKKSEKLWIWSVRSCVTVV